MHRNCHLQNRVLLPEAVFVGLFPIAIAYEPCLCFGVLVFTFDGLLACASVTGLGIRAAKASQQGPLTIAEMGSEVQRSSIFFKPHKIPL